MGKSILALIKTSALFVYKHIAAIFEDLVVLGGLAFIVRASYLVSPMVGHYTLGGILVLVGLAMSAGLKQQQRGR